MNSFSLLAEVSHDEAKMREKRETSAGFRRVSYHACAGVSLTTSDVFLTCDTTHRTGLRAKRQLKARVCCGEFFAMWNDAGNSTISQIWGKRVRGDALSPNLRDCGVLGIVSHCEEFSTTYTPAFNWSFARKPVPWVVSHVRKTSLVVKETPAQAW